MIKDKKNISLALITTLLLFPLFALKPSLERRTMVAIYSQILAYHPRPDADATIDACTENTLVFGSQTSRYPILMREGWQVASANLPNIQNGTWANLIETNADSSPFPDDLPLGCKYKVLDAKSDEKEYSSTCPILHFSKIGFNEDKTQAVVYLSTSCGGWSFGSYYLLSLVESRWQVTGTMTAHYVD